MMNKAARLDEYAPLVDAAVKYAKEQSKEGASASDKMALLLDALSVEFGTEILKHVPGYVSTEVDARLSFDLEGNIERARRIIEMYAAKGIGKDRVLIKLASTWEGLQAAKTLQAEGINCNMTLLFNFAQAAVAADVGATLISPFVGRIYDWQKKSEGKEEIPAEDDLGVSSVRKIYNYYKVNGFETIVMGASFRNTGQVKALAGCDRLTISPKLLGQLREDSEPLERVLSPEAAKEDKEAPSSPVKLDEKSFRWELSQDEMATEKLHDGIRRFAADIVKLEEFLQSKIDA